MYSAPDKPPSTLGSASPDAAGNLGYRLARQGGAEGVGQQGCTLVG